MFLAIFKIRVWFRNKKSEYFRNPNRKEIDSDNFQSSKENKQLITNISQNPKKKRNPLRTLPNIHIEKKSIEHI